MASWTAPDTERIARVYMLVEKLETVGGVAEQVTLLATELKRRQIDVRVLARRVLGRDNQYALRLQAAGVRVAACPGRLYGLDLRPTWGARSALVRALSRLTYPLLVPVALVDAALRRRPVRASWAGVVGRVRGRLGGLIMRDVLADAYLALLDRHAAEAPPDVVDVSGVDCLPGVAWAHRRGYPVVYRQTSLPNSEEPLSARQIAELHCATCLLAVSRAAARHMRAWLRDDRPVWVVPNAVPDPGREGDRSNGHHGGPPERALVVCLSRLSDEKGVLHIPEVARRVLRVAPEARFVVAGEGPLRLVLEQRCLTLGLGDAVRFLGDLAHDRALDLLRHADVMFLPSRREGMPVTAIEAMALGKAMVVTAAGGTPELVQDGVSALVVPVDDIDAMAQGLLRVIDDGALRQRLGQAARLAYERGPYRPHTVAGLTLVIYHRSLDTVAPPPAPVAIADPGLPGERRGA